MMHNEHLSAQISELRWLVYELGHEVKTLETTSRPHVHQFLMHGLVRRVAQVAEATCSSLVGSLTSPVEGPASLVVEPQRAHVSSQKGQETL
jgi:hypothetical protein